MRIFLLLNIISLAVSAQNGNQLLWDSGRKLAANDFQIKTKDLETSLSFAQFSVDYNVTGFDFLTKNFNKKVRNYLIKSASWIDTTTNVQLSLRYQQTLFDLCEIYTRLFRKELRENRKKLANGMSIAEELNSKAMTDSANRRVLYDRETKFGSIEIKQKEWESLIQKELMELSNYAYDK